MNDFTGARGGGDGALGRGRGGNGGFFSFSSTDGDRCLGELTRLLSEAAGAIGKVLDLFGRGGGGTRPRDTVEFELGEGDGDDLKAAS